MPNQDYAAQLWSPYYKMDMESSECVQRMTRIIYFTQGEIKTTLFALLEMHTLHSDLIKVFKWVKDLQMILIKYMLKLKRG